MAGSSLNSYRLWHVNATSVKCTNGKRTVAQHHCSASSKYIFVKVTNSILKTFFIIINCSLNWFPDLLKWIIVFATFNGQEYKKKTLKSGSALSQGLNLNFRSMWTEMLRLVMAGNQWVLNIQFLCSVNVSNDWTSIYDKFYGTYVTSLREFLSSKPRFWMYCHCSSDMLCPPI